MLFEDERGEGVEFDGDRSDEIGLDLTRLSDEELQAFLAQLLARVGFTSDRAGRILRVGAERLAELGKLPIPGHLFEAFERDAAERIAPEPTTAPKVRVDRSRRS